MRLHRPLLALALIALASAPLHAQPGAGPISGGGGGSSSGEATSVQGSATLPATCTEKDLYQDTNSGGTEFHVCTATDTWTKASAFDQTAAGAIAGVTQLDADNLRLDGNTLSSTDANGNINLTPNGTGQVLFTGDDTATTPTIAVAAGTGISGHSSGSYLQFVSAGVVRAWFLNSSFALQGSTAIAGAGGFLSGLRHELLASTAGSGAPNVLGATQLDYVITNEGSAAENYHTLPGAVAGYEYTFIVQDSDGIRITAAAGDTIRIGASVSAAAGFIRCLTVGGVVKTYAINATEWIVDENHVTCTIDS